MLDSFVAEKGLSYKIHLLGQSDNKEMSKFWNKQDIAINTSDNEGRPLSNMEAMISGAVPVVTETMGCIEDVIDGVNGCAVPIGDYKLMAKKIEFLNINRDEFRRLSQNAEQIMREKVNMDKHFD